MEYTHATIQDLDNLVKLASRADPDSTFQSVKKWTQENMRDFPNLQFLAKNDNRIVGFVSGIANEEYMTIEDIAVDQDYEHQGIASELLALVENAAQKVGIFKFRAWVNIKNAKVAPFYHANAYSQRDEFVVRDIEGVPDGEKFYLFEKRLDGIT